MVTSTDLISAYYLEQQRLLHQAPRGYGGRGDKWSGIVVQLAVAYKAQSVLDYGAGQGTLGRALRAQQIRGLAVSEYDPAIPGKDALPERADLVVCTDVLEHIEPERLDAVLQHLRALAKKALWVVISTKASNKVMADGRNAHLIIEPPSWWKDRVRAAGFTLHSAPTIVRTVPKKEWAVVLTP